MKKLLKRLSDMGELTLVDLDKAKAVYGGSELYDSSDFADTSTSYDHSQSADSSTSFDS